MWDQKSQSMMLSKLFELPAFDSFINFFVFLK